MIHKEFEVDSVISVSLLKEKLMRKINKLLDKPTLVSTELKVIAEILKDLDDDTQKTYIELLQRTMGMLESSKAEAFTNIPSISSIMDSTKEPVPTPVKEVKAKKEKVNE